MQMPFRPSMPSLPTAVPHPVVLILLTSLLSSNVPLIGGQKSSNPFTPKAYLIRYWNNKVYNVPISNFLLSKASPLSAADAAIFTKLASQKTLSAHLHSFCQSAHLLCFPDPRPSLEKHTQDSNFATYDQQNFTNYGTGRPGSDTFKRYSPDDNVVVDTFRRYGRDAAGRSDGFDQYGSNGNVITQTFNTYGTHATGGSGQFTNYAEQVNVPGLAFTSYSASSTKQDQSFAVYSDQTNAGSENFASYGKDGKSAGDSFIAYGNESNVIGSGFSSYGSGGDAGSRSNFTSYGAGGNGPSNNFKNYGKDGHGVPNSFTNYGDGSNVLASGFSGYSEGSDAGRDVFASYGVNGNVPEENFNNYGDGGKGVVESFKGYRDQSNVGDSSFQSYARKSNAAEVNFTSYGQSFNQGTEKFTGYGSGAASNQVGVGFTTYGLNSTFKGYDKGARIAFAKYNISIDDDANARNTTSARIINRWVEPGKFFREKMLRSGVVMPMPDIKDKMPQRAFLPRSIVSKIPFSSGKVDEMIEVFHAFDNSTMETMIKSALAECERAPSRGEAKRCVGSAEDMIDFAVSVLGHSPELRTTENVNGAKEDVMVGDVRGINGGEVTHSVSCHQSLYPYLLYYCHSVPKVRLYEADILDPATKKKINHGTAICHLDTSDWSPTHGAFLALGSGPGKIEVCHWIFENDLTWTIAD